MKKNISNKIEDIDYIKGTDKFYSIQNTDIVWIDEATIQREILEKGVFHHHDAKSLMVKYGSVVSEKQACSNQVNLDFDISEDCLTGFRPERYGRASLFEVLDDMEKPTTLLDIKGCGVFKADTPTIDFHATGLLDSVTAIKELINQAFLNTIFRSANTNFDTVNSYALLNLNQKATFPWGNDAAFTVVRQGHLRPKNNNELPFWSSDEHIVKIAIELFLRFFKVTTSYQEKFRLFEENGKLNYRLFNGQRKAGLTEEHIKLLTEDLGTPLPHSFGFSNIQMCRYVSTNPLSATLVDFGPYLFDTVTNIDTLFLVRDKPLNWGGRFSELLHHKIITPQSVNNTWKIAREALGANSKSADWIEEVAAEISIKLLSKDQEEEGKIQINRVLDFINNTDIFSENCKSFTFSNYNININELLEVCYETAYLDIKNKIPNCLQK